MLGVDMWTNFVSSALVQLRNARLVQVRHLRLASSHKGNHTPDCELPDLLGRTWRDVRPNVCASTQISEAAARTQSHML